MRRVALVILGVLGLGAGCGQSAAGMHDRPIIVRDREVLLVPPIQAGIGGWCMTYVGAGMWGWPGRGCLKPEGKIGPIFTESWSGGSPPPVRTGVALVRSNVAAVSIDGESSIPTRAEPSLPAGLRSVFIEIHNSSRGGARFPTFAAQDRHGTLIRQAEMAGPPLAFQMRAVRLWQEPAEIPNGVCGIHTAPFRPLIAQSGAVVAQLRSGKGIIGRPFLSCASTQYLLGEVFLKAAVLLDAKHPGTTPGPLPKMRKLAGHPGVFEALGSEGEMLARRVPGAWLVVAKGASVKQRLSVLEHISATLQLSA
jgi:hypothetical protein